MAHLPFSIYLGWINVATIANATALLVHLNWSTFGPGNQFWAIAVIIVGMHHSPEPYRSSGFIG